MHQRALLPLLCALLAIYGFPYNLHPVSCGDINFKKAQITYWPGNQATIFLDGLMGPSALCKLFCWVNWSGVAYADCNGRLTCFVIIWSTHKTAIIQTATSDPATLNTKKCAQQPLNLQRAVVPDWTSNWGYIKVFIWGKCNPLRIYHDV